MTIWKYTLGITERQYIHIPTGGRILHVGQQDGELCVWALVDAHQESYNMEIAVVGTGHPCPYTRHLGSVVIGKFVWHVFEV